MSSGIVIDDVVDDVKRIQEFNPESLVRREKLGDMAFEEAVEPAKRLISIFSKLSLGSIPEFPSKQLDIIQRQAKSAYSLFDQILNFSLSVSDPSQQRTQYIEALRDEYQPAFDKLYPYISYSVARTVDFASLESRARAALQAINDEKEKMLAALETTSEQAETLLQDVRDAAAEQGVSQMARYFGAEADAHKASSSQWLKASIAMAVVVFLYSVMTFFIPHWMNSQTQLSAVQVTVSKILVFGVLVFGLSQCIKIYSAHRHNFVTNKHRQNALLTFKTLAEAGQTPEARDVVLQYAASAIYVPADSGYLKNEERSASTPSLINVSPKGILGGASSADIH